MRVGRACQLARILLGCLLTLSVLVSTASGCTFSQLAIKVEASAIRATANLDGAGVPGLSAVLTRLERRLCDPDDDDCEELQEIPAGKLLTDQAGVVEFRIKRGTYRLEFTRGELSSWVGIEVTDENGATVPIMVEWPQIGRISARTVSGNLSAQRLRDSGKGYIHDIALKRDFEIVPYEGARVSLIDFDNREVSGAVADKAGNFVLPAQLPGYYLLRIIRPSESKPFHKQSDPEITGLFRLSDDAKFPDLSMKLNNVCGGSFTQDAASH